MKCKVVNEFNSIPVGTVIELNDRRAKSELRNGNVIKVREPVKKTKEQKFKRKTK